MPMSVTGIRELVANLNALGKVLTPEAVTDVLLDSGEPMRQRMADFAPRGDEPPHLADHIGIMPTPTRANETAAIRIGPTKGFAYGTPQEYGTVRHPAHPFMRPAFDTDHQAATVRIGQGLWREIEDAV